MIKFGLLEWSHVFSYGANNSIDLSKEPLLQLVGKNGHGKSSIALILEEVLYNKNSKDSKKTKSLAFLKSRGIQMQRFRQRLLKVRRHRLHFLKVSQKTKSEQLLMSKNLS
jgi:ABC-type glutathione transport system ATPase component